MSAVGGSVVIQVGSKHAIAIGRRSAPAGAQAGSHAIHRVVCNAVKHHKPQRGDGSHRLRLRRPYRGWVEIGTQASTGCTRGYMPEPLPGLLARLSEAACQAFRGCLPGLPGLSGVVASIA